MCGDGDLPARPGRDSAWVPCLIINTQLCSELHLSNIDTETATTFKHSSDASGSDDYYNKIAQPSLDLSLGMPLLSS